MIGALVARLLSCYVRRCPPHRGMYRVVKALAALCPGQPVLSRYGVLMVCRPRDLTFLFAILGRHDDVYQTLKEKLRPDMCLLDVGANQGVFTLVGALAVGKEGRVLSFEPSRREFRDLLRNLEINGVDNVLPFFCGLSDAGGTGLLQVAPDVHSGKSHYVDGAGQLSLQLDLREWDSHIQSLIGGRETWIKIDVEGYEVRVIRSLEKVLCAPATRGVIVEIEERQLSAQGFHAADIYQEMARMGYTPFFGTEKSVYNEIFLRNKD
jgi:FkbM family methyltransferase